MYFPSCLLRDCTLLRQGEALSLYRTVRASPPFEISVEAPGLDILFLSVLGCTVRIRCQEGEARRLLTANYVLRREPPEHVELEYVIGKYREGSSYFLQRGSQPVRTVAEADDLLFFFEEDLTLELQRVRANLYFLHAAALEWAGKACLFVAPSGSGKSTTTWGLLHHGLGYLSDELGPVDLNTLKVHPYPHAICLKAEPPVAYPLPVKVLRTTQTFHIPPDTLPGKVSTDPLPLAALFFVQYNPHALSPTVHPLSKAEAGVRVFASALNPLAHPGEGLDGAIKIAAASPCFKLTTADLPSTCRLVQSTIEGLVGQ